MTDQDILAAIGFAPPNPADEATADSLTVDGASLAKAFGLSQRAVTALAKDGIAVRVGRGTYDLLASVQNYIAKLRRPDGSEKERLTRAQADLAELKLAEARGELVPAAQVQAEWDSILRTLRASIMGVPARVQANLGHLSAHDVAVIDREIRDTLTDLGNGHANA